MEGVEMRILRLYIYNTSGQLRQEKGRWGCKIRYQVVVVVVIRDYSATSGSLVSRCLRVVIAEVQDLQII
jgi:hypothetical protein